ncbi:MAG: hypothetical protein ACPGSM_16330 [Thiolinea sp.]
MGILKRKVFLISNLVICCLSIFMLIGCGPEEESTFDQTDQRSPAQPTRQARDNAIFSPSLGINTEAAQPEGATVGDALMFVDLFRTARPFQELSTGITVDEYGWPTSIATDGVARTYMMQNIPANSIPYGDYIMLYEGSGEVGFGSNVTINPLPTTLLSEGYQGRTVTISPSTQQINIVITGISEGEGNYVKNIRLIMPGGICGTNTHIRVTNASSCSENQPYQSFVDKLKNDRNQIVFNPDYLNFMKDFNTIRLMNLLAASPGRSHCLDGDNPGQLITSCITHEITWGNRPQLSDAAWGGSAKTSLSTESYVTNPVPRQGVPIEVAVELVNQLNVNPWFNIHHAASNDYISRFAEYVYQNLSSDLQIYLEYSNETWNSGFIGFHYAQIKGIEQGFNTVPTGFQGSSNRDENYFARLRYYSKRSVEVFDLWENAFGNTDRFVRTLSGFQGDTILSRELLAFQNAAQNLKVDALAIAPYFSGCIVAEYACASAPMLLPNVQTVDDVFAAIDWEPAPNGLKGILRQIEKHAEIANNNSINLLAYEGGQNLVITGSFPTLSDPFENAANNERLRSLFFEANRDARMKQRYLDLLNGWHMLADQGTALFALYTQPQSYYQYGSWGIKESLQQSRTDAPKYDAAMTFQETVQSPWWLPVRNMEGALSVLINYLLNIDNTGSSHAKTSLNRKIAPTEKIPTPDELYSQQMQQIDDVKHNALPPTIPNTAVIPDDLKTIELLHDNLPESTKNNSDLHAETLADYPIQPYIPEMIQAITSEGIPYKHPDDFETNDTTKSYTNTTSMNHLNADLE